MTQTLSRSQASALGLVIVLACLLGGWGLYQMAVKQGFWEETIEVVAGFPEVHDVKPGTPVRVRGMEAGQVVQVNYPQDDSPGSAVEVKMRLKAEIGQRLYQDAWVSIQSAGLLGQKVISIHPGSPEAGSLEGRQIAVKQQADMAMAAARLTEAADEASALLREVRESEGTIFKLLKDDDLYYDLKNFAAEARDFVRKADIAVEMVELEAGNVRTLVADGRDTLRSVRQGTDAVQKLPIIRGYVEDPVALLTRPDARKEYRHFAETDLFEPGTAILSPGGKRYLNQVAEWLKGVRESNTDVVVAAGHSPDDHDLSAAESAELTKKQAEAVTQHLWNQGAHKIGWVSRRKITPIGLGANTIGVGQAKSLPPSFVQVVLFIPQ